MRNDYTQVIRLFTKISKYLIPFSKKGLFLAYVDETYEECLFNVLNSVEISRPLVFTMYLYKSRFFSSQCITYFGFFRLSPNEHTFNTREIRKNLHSCADILKKVQCYNKVLVKTNWGFRRRHSCSVIRTNLLQNFWQYEIEGTKA